MRTMVGGPCWSVSADQGETWTQPRRLLLLRRARRRRQPLSQHPLLHRPLHHRSRVLKLFLHRHCLLPDLLKVPLRLQFPILPSQEKFRQSLHRPLQNRRRWRRRWRR